MVIRSCTLHSRKLFLLNFKRKKARICLRASLFGSLYWTEPVTCELTVRQAFNKKKPTELRGNCLE